MLSTDAYNSQGEIAKGFKFLQNLGLNHLHWMDKGYLKSNYGKQWQIEYQKCKEDLPFYHRQLEPIASRILKALNDKEIEILDQGRHKITEELKTQLESDTILKIKHKASNKT